MTNKLPPTRRAGASGVADTLFTRADAKHAKEIVRILADSAQSISPELQAMARQGGGGCGGYGGRGGGGGRSRWW